MMKHSSFLKLVLSASILFGVAAISGCEEPVARSTPEVVVKTKKDDFFKAEYERQAAEAKAKKKKGH